MFCPQSVVVLISLVIYCNSEILGTSDCKFDVKMKLNLRNEGFHRNLTYGLVFNTDREDDKWLYHDCMVAIEQGLPRGLFVNPDELDDLRRMNKLSAIAKNKVNVEMTAEQADDIGVFVLGKVGQSRSYLWLPVHARYHKARAGGGMVRNKIPSPKLFLRCPDQRLETCSRNSTAANFLCNGSSRDKCSWKEVPFTLVSSNIHWSIPVGNTDHYNIVAWGTAGVVIIGTIYILKVVHEYKVAESIKKQQAKNK